MTGRNTAAEAAASLPPRPIAFILALAAPYRGRLMATVVAAGLSAMLGLIPLVAIYFLAKGLFDGAATPRFVTMIAALAITATAAQLVCAATANRWGHAVAFAVQEDVRLRLLERIASAPASRIEGRAGVLKKVIMGDVDRLEGLLAHVIPDITAGLTTPILASIILMTVDWRLMLASLALVPLAFLTQAWTYRGRTDLFEQWNTTEAHANTALLSYVRGIATLRAFNRQASTLAHVTDAILSLRDLAIMVSRHSRYPYALFGSALSANLLVVLPVAMWLQMEGRIDLPDCVAAVLLGAGLLVPLNKVVFATQIAARTGVAIGRIKGVLETQPMDGPSAGELSYLSLPGGNSLRLEHVSFTYPDGQAALSDLCCDIPEGRLTALVGPSGAGKSTLARLILRLDDCTVGGIFIGGVDIRAIPLDDLRARLAAVFQDATLFPGTVADNVAMAAPPGDEAGAAEALRQAQAERIGGSLAQTLSLELGDRGARLSGGEKQRIAIARAIAKNAPILVLDEATAFVDPANERELQQALARAGTGRTVIVVAHRISTIRNADQIIVLNGGQIEAVGRHETLLATSPTYRMLVAAQDKAMNWTMDAGSQAAAQVPC
ncbi:ABC transporter ATP-binding protein [Hyphomicrobiales bacterium]|nr:ABC transporter ATP-binding protein [Hyphomicrobiales bacterium]CAH1689495.1 ABC transporter ATP-binding protein [Hyphomicrobiales bacterium]